MGGTAGAAFDAALAELLRAWRVRQAVLDDPDVGLEERLAAWRTLDRARTWVASFEGAGRQPGLRSAARPSTRPATTSR